MGKWTEYTEVIYFLRKVNMWNKYLDRITELEWIVKKKDKQIKFYENQMEAISKSLDYNARQIIRDINNIDVIFNLD